MEWPRQTERIILVAPLSAKKVATETGANPESWIDVEGVTKAYVTRTGDVVQALTEVSLKVKRGEFVSLVGPSGCGKTTLLKILAGLISHTTGSVSIAGVRIHGPQTKTGLVFQAPTLLPWRTILDNVMLPVEIQKLDKAMYRRRAQELLELVGLSGFESKYPTELSGGMQQRAGICRALIHDPEVLLMDEPFGALDAMTREYMNVELLKIWKESGKTVIFVTHSIPEAVFLSDRVVVMSPRPGKIEEVIDDELPRPRALTDMNSEQAGVYVNRIRQYFSAEGAID